MHEMKVMEGKMKLMDEEVKTLKQEKDEEKKHFHGQLEEALTDGKK